MSMQFVKNIDEKPPERSSAQSAEAEIERIKSEFLSLHKEVFYTADMLMELAEVPPGMRSAVRNKLQTASLKYGIKKISSSGKPVYGISDLCPIDYACYRGWCSGRVLKYGSCVPACPRRDKKNRPEFVEK
ncbi:MAG: hypothetical protein QXU82_02590 [Candidatus Aenigmatarchaeota archaeon]